MKTKNAIKSLAAFVVVLVVAAVPTSAQEWWWPPTEPVAVAPENPGASDVVSIMLGGEWPDSCVPEGSSVLVCGNDILFSVFPSPETTCYFWIAGWSQTQSVGPLAPGTYTVHAGLYPSPGLSECLPPGVYTEVAQFTVSDGCTCLGDLDGDAWLSSADISALVALLIGQCNPLMETCYFWFPYDLDPCADMNEDGWLSPSDISGLVSMLLPYQSNYYWRYCE